MASVSLTTTQPNGFSLFTIDRILGLDRPEQTTLHTPHRPWTGKIRHGDVLTRQYVEPVARMSKHKFDKFDNISQLYDDPACQEKDSFRNHFL